MYELVVTIRNKLLRAAYLGVVKPIFFLLDPEKVHDRAIRSGKFFAATRVGQKFISFLFSYKHKSLEQHIEGITFPNPIGLAAGFDKNAELTKILPSVGFGFAEVGSITGEQCAGNTGKRLWRLPKSNSLVVYYGLKNNGCEAIAKKLTNKTFIIPIGISIAKTNSPDTCEVAEGIADYAKAFETMKDIGHYMTINISCPNAHGGEPFSDPGRLERLLTQLDAIEYDKPVFLKLAADHTLQELDALLDVALKHRIHGFVCTNLAKDRNNKRSMSKVKETKLPDVGGLSGKVVEDLATETIRHVYKRTKGSKIIIGVGGIFTAQDAYTKIKAGANLLQLITGMIYQGPQTISEINQGLVRLLKEDGFSNISQAVGARNET